MTLPIILILSCLVILTTAASDIHIQKIREIGSPKQLAVSEIPAGQNLLLGSGAKPNQLPIAVYNSNLSDLYVSIYIQLKKPCKFTFSGRDGTLADVEKVKQFADNKIACVWHEKENNNIVATTISIIDIDACVNRKDLKFTWDVPLMNSLEVVPFVDGFDVINSINSRASYDTNGNQIGKSKYFPTNSHDFSISPISVTSRTNDGFFIADYFHGVLNLVKGDGKLVKLLLDIPHLQVISNSEQGSYSVCTFNTDLNGAIHCYQYDEGGNKKWSNKVLIAISGLLDVKNLPGGGLVFAAWYVKKNQLYVVEMGPKQVDIWSYSPELEFGSARFVDFNKEDRSFNLAYKALGLFEESVALQKYSLVSSKLN